LFGNENDGDASDDGVDILDGGDGADACLQDDDGVIVSC
jgi:hypothetical protein